MLTPMSESNQLPEAAILMTHEVADWTTWKAHFDAHESARKAGGCLGHHLNRGYDNPNIVSIYLALGDVAKAKAFSQSPDLGRAMKNAGVIGAPTVVWMKPLLEHVVWDRELPAMMVSHTVADVDKWLTAYKAAAGIQKQGGIIGNAANQSLDDSNLVIVYHQAETHDALKAFLATPGLKDAMTRAGVTSEPKVTFHTGGWAKMY